MSIVWTEIDAAMPSLLMAGRQDDLPASRGDAMAALVQFTASRLNSASINYRIRSELERQRAMAERLLPVGYSGGILAVAEYDVLRTGELDSSVFNFCNVQPLRFAEPRDGIGWFERQRRRGELRIDRPMRVEVVRRFFWGSRRR